MKNKFSKGISLVEALVSTAIVAIGFLAVFQLVNYSVNSIGVSAERTKINYLSSMIAEDMIGSRDETANTNPSSKQCLINDYGIPTALDGTPCPETIKKFAEYVRTNPSAFEFNTCSGKGGPIFSKENMTNLYKNAVAEGAPENKANRWQVILGEDRYLKCRGDRDIKKIKMYKICRWDDVCQNYTDARINDNGMYIGRIQFNLNNGKKRKFLYFHLAF